MTRWRSRAPVAFFEETPVRPAGGTPVAACLTVRTSKSTNAVSSSCFRTVKSSLFSQKNAPQLGTY